MGFLFHKDTCMYFPFPNKVEPQAQDHEKKLLF